jgi:2,6-dihydroxypseudooxynicotine hydrolase
LVQAEDLMQDNQWALREASLEKPRYIANGSDPNDVERVCARILRNDDWMPEWCASGAAHEHQARQAEQEGHMFSAGEAYVRAALSYHWAKKSWLGALSHEDQYHQAHSKSIETYWKGLQLLDPTAELVEIPYDGITMPAHLRRPSGPSRAPIVILVPGGDSSKEEFFHWANVFLNRGMAVLAPDGPGQGETRNRMPVRHDYEGAGSAMIDYLHTRDDVDVSAIGVVGISLGGYYAPRIACFEHRIKAVMSISGAFKAQTSAQNVGPWAMFTHWAETPEAVVEMTARRTLDGIISNIACPYLVVNGKQDAVIPYTSTEEMAREAEAAGVDVTYVLYEEGNHVCFNISYECRPLVGDWMADRLKAA